MTPMTRKALEALAADENGTLSFVDLRRACGATMRGFRQIKARMEDKSLVEPAPYCGVPRLTITPLGRAALDVQ